MHNFKDKLIILQERYFEYLEKSLLKEKQRKELTFNEFATLFFIDDTQSLQVLEEEELLEEVFMDNE